MHVSSDTQFAAARRQFLRMLAGRAEHARHVAVPYADEALGMKAVHKPRADESYAEPFPHAASGVCVPLCVVSHCACLRRVPPSRFRTLTDR